MPRDPRKVAIDTTQPQQQYYYCRDLINPRVNNKVEVVLYACRAQNEKNGLPLQPGRSGLRVRETVQDQDRCSREAEESVAEGF